MSRDIRSYFTNLSKKPVPSKTDTSAGNSSKKRSISDLNSSDDIVPDTPEINVKKNNKNNDKLQSKRRRIVVVSSDSETENDSSKKISSKASQKIANKSNQKTTKEVETQKTSKLNQKTTKVVEVQKTISKKKVNPLDAFGSEPIVQDKIKKSQQTELNIHGDDDFDKTLIDLDEDELFQKAGIKTINKEERQNVNKSSVSSDDSKNTPIKKKEERQYDKIISVSSDDSKNTPTKMKKVTPMKKGNTSYNDNKEKTPARKRKSNEDEDDPTMDPDQERFEKKRHSALLYQKYLNRSGPAHLGAKWIPKGKPNCLNGFCFIITGVLDSMQRDDAQALIVEHGGRCTQSVSGKVNYMVLGDDAGPAKVERARKLGTKMISENDLIDLICLKSGIKNQNIKNEPSSENNLSQENLTSRPTDTEMKQEKSVTPAKQQRNKTPAKQEKTKSPVKKEMISDDEDDIPSTTVKQEIETKERVKIVPKTDISKKKVAPEKKIDVNSLAWVDRYKPANISQIIGQQGERSNMNKLLKWLQNWHAIRARETLGKGISKPSPWAKDDDGAYFRAALLSGPSGVGKTTTATLVCEHLGLDTVEFNASDTRNKRMVHAEVSHILSTTSLAGYAADGAAPTRQHALLMDEVDGMSGNEDRGGIQELIGLIKTSNVPIICMCNDRQHPKIRTLANYCFDLRFSKPRVEQIRGAMMSICFKEKLPIKGDALSQIIQGTGQDVRQTLNQLALLAAGAGSDAEQVAKQARAAQKDVKLGPWEVVRKVFSEEEHKNMSFMDHSKLFFYDYSIGPLFVQENYLKVVPHCPKSEHLQRFAQAADAISLGDVVDARIRSTQSWGLLDVQAMYASVLPGHYLRGHMAGQIDFPAWLGKNSKATKFTRLLSEIHGHTRMSTSCDRTSVTLDLVRPLRDAVAGPLLRDGANGVAHALDTMRAYSLLREDLASLVELARWPRTRDPFDQVDSKVKAAFTRAYNKDSPALPYAVPAAGPVKKRATTTPDDMYGEEDDAGAYSDDEKDDDIQTDGMIKMKKPGATKTATATKPSSSRGKASTRGRGGKRGK